MADGQQYYRVRRGDTLSGIAKRTHTTIAQLTKINGIVNANHIATGQLIALKPEAALKVEIQMLDRDRNPIPGAKLRLEHNGRIVERVSGQDGRVAGIVTETPDDIVKIWIQRADKSWKQITQITSDWGNKLVTLISPKIKIEAKTQPHPQAKNKRPLADPPQSARSSRKKPEVPRAAPATEDQGAWRVPMVVPKVAATTAKGDPQSLFSSVTGQFGIKSMPITYENGLPSFLITNDQPEFEFLKNYTGAKISEADYEAAAKDIGCEAAVVKAVAKVETGKAPFDDKNRPTILYERHVFARNTSPHGKFDKDNPDVSGYKKTYKLSNEANRKLVKDDKLHDYDIYGNSYPRLSKAYKLDKEAALKACSWGKFQILGENFKACGFDSIVGFVNDIAISEVEHLKVFVNLVKADKVLRDAAKSKDWTAFAKRYNGKNYRKYTYDTKLKNAYNEFMADNQ